MEKKKTISARSVDQMNKEELYAAWGTTREEHMARLKSLIARKNAAARKLLGEMPERPKATRVSRDSSAYFGGFTAARWAAISKLGRCAQKAGIAKGVSAEGVTFIDINGYTIKVEDLNSNRLLFRGRTTKKGKFGKVGRVVKPEGLDLAVRRGLKMALIETPEGKQGLVVNTLKGIHKLRGKKGPKGPRW